MCIRDSHGVLLVVDEFLEYDPNGVVRNASQGFGGAARQAIVNAREKRADFKGPGSLDLSRRRLQSPKRGSRAVSGVRTVPTNPFENAANSEPCTGAPRVRKGDDGGWGVRYTIVSIATVIFHVI